jgi:ribosomal protein S18 acetylase RimI-like enzyme
VSTFGFGLEFGGRQATLTDLFIKPHHRSKGLGLAMLSHLELTLANIGVGALELQVSCGNRRAFEFYKAAGFTAHARIPMSKPIH